MYFKKWELLSKNWLLGRKWPPKNVFLLIRRQFCYDTDFDGYDINAESSHTVYAAGPGKRISAKECHGLCQTTTVCAFFSWKSNTGECWLKTTDKGRGIEIGTTSGPKNCETEAFCKHIIISMPYIMYNTVDRNILNTIYE